MNRYVKAIVAVIGAVVTSALTIWGPDTSVGQVLVVASALVTALSVYAFPNEQPVPEAVRSVYDARDAGL